MKENKTKGQIIITQLLDYLGIKAPTFSNVTGIPYGTVYSIQTGKTAEITKGVAFQIQSAYPDINYDWLIGNSNIMIVRNKGKSNIKTKIKETPVGNPFFTNFTAQGGDGHGAGTEQALLPDGYMSIPGINPTPDIPFILVRGKSMLNTDDPEHSIAPGSWVAVKKVMGEAIRWGEVYAVMTVDGPIIKQLMPSEKDNCIKCVSLNKNFPPFDLPTTDIIEGEIYIVKGVVGVQIWN